MAITNISDFTIYDEQLQGGYMERLGQNDQIFNEASGGTIRLVSNPFLGNYKKETFFKTLGTAVIARQDTTSNAAQTPIKMAQGEHVSVKLWRKMVPVTNTFNAFKEIGKDAQKEGSFLIGQSYADAMTKEMVNTAITCLRVAIANQSTNLYDATGDTIKTVTHSNILSMLAKYGDASSRIRTLVMHSNSQFGLMQQALKDGFEVIAANDVIKAFYVPAFGLKVIVSDSPGLVVTGSPNTYYVLGLTEGAATVSEIEDPMVATDIQLGYEQMQIIMQGEYRYALGLKGFTWDVANGASNPSNSALATGSNWDMVVSNYQDLAGVCLKVQTS